MFTANPELELLFLASPSLYTEPYELTNTRLVDALEGVTGQDTALNVVWKKVPRIIAR